MTRDYRLFVKDIMEAIQDIEAFVDDMDFDSFQADRKMMSAVVWRLEVIGEDTKNVPATIRSKYRELPWKGYAR